MIGWLTVPRNWIAALGERMDESYAAHQFYVKPKLSRRPSEILYSQVAATFQSIPGPQILASGTYTNAQIQPSLGRPLSSGSTATVSLVEPGTLYVERLNQVDLRFTKIFRAGIARFRGMVDLYNVFNDNTVLKQSDAYGATIGPATGSAWQVPQAIIPGRVVKFGVQVNF